MRVTVWILGIVLSLVSLSAHAVDKGVYEGQWRATFPAISLKIGSTSASFTLNQKTYTDPSPQYFYGQLAPFPFLYLYVQEPSKERKYAFYEHRLYLIMGEENKMLPNASGTLKLRGYYDLARVQRGGNGLVENQTYPILFERPPKKK